jgi:hypothetical protein
MGDGLLAAMPVLVVGFGKLPVMAPIPPGVEVLELGNIE